MHYAVASTLYPSSRHATTCWNGFWSHSLFEIATMKRFLACRYRRSHRKQRHERSLLQRMLDEGNWLSIPDDPRTPSYSLKSYLNPLPEKEDNIFILLDYVDHFPEASLKSYLKDLIRDMGRSGSLPMRTWRSFIRYFRFDREDDPGTNEYFSNIPAQLYSVSSLSKYLRSEDFPSRLRACIDPLIFPRFWHLRFFTYACRYYDGEEDKQCCVKLSEALRSLVRATTSIESEITSILNILKMMKGTQINEYDSDFRSRAELVIGGVTYATFEVVRKYSKGNLLSKYPWEYWKGWFNGNHYMLTFVVFGTKKARRLEFGVIDPTTREYTIIRTCNLFGAEGRIEFTILLLKIIPVLKGYYNSHVDESPQRLWNAEYSLHQPVCNIHILPVVYNNMLMLEVQWTARSHALFIKLRKNLERLILFLADKIEMIKTDKEITSNREFLVLEVVSIPQKNLAKISDFSIRNFFLPYGCPLFSMKCINFNATMVSIIELMELHLKHSIVFQSIPWDIIFVSSDGKVFFTDYSQSRMLTHITSKSYRKAQSHLIRCTGNLLLDDRVKKFSTTNWKPFGKFLLKRSSDTNIFWVLKELLK